MPALEKNHAPTAIIIPACNEEAALPRIIPELRAALPENWIIIAGVNGSTDRTAEVARRCGIEAAVTSQRGYGAGCLCAVEFLKKKRTPVAGYLFYAADGANAPADALRVAGAGAPLIIGTRTRRSGNIRRLGLARFFANLAFGALQGLLTGRFATDLGPLRYIDAELFERLGMREAHFGWTIEAQIKAARLGVQSVEVPVEERRRIAGKQKVSGVSLLQNLQVFLHIVCAAWRARFAPLPQPEKRKPARGEMFEERSAGVSPAAS